jgi:hypothetical protein
VTNLVPAISVSPGASVSPASGTARDFSGPVIYTVTAEDGSTAVWNVTAVEALTGLDDLVSYLSAAPGGGQTNPVPLTLLDINLADDWGDLLTALDGQSKFVALDLSYCAMTGTEFNPGTGTAGVNKIVSLTLPVSAESLAGGTSAAPTFEHFTVLESVTGAGIKTVGEYAFYDCDALEEVTLPAAQTIGQYAFAGCDLEEVNLPAAHTIGGNAFLVCNALEEVNLPAAHTIGGGAFAFCSALETVNLPASLTTISGNPFGHCGKLTALNVDSANPAYKSQSGMLLNKAGTTLVAYPSAKEDVTLTGITALGAEAFAGCSALEEVSLPAAHTIGGWAFFGCNALEEVNLPAAQSIGEVAFGYTGSASLTITLGTTVPTLGVIIFDGTSTKPVTVKVPSGITAWDSIVSGSPYQGGNTTNNWGNAFRGKGWDGTNYLGGTVNGNINLTIQPD